MAQNTAIHPGGPDLEIRLRLVRGRLGRLFYQVGETAEYQTLRVLRTSKELIQFLGRLTHRLVHPLFATVAAGLRELGEDLTAPFRRARMGFSHIRELVADERANGLGHAAALAAKYLVSGVHRYAYLGKNLLYYLLPLAAGGVFVFTVHTLLSADYALAVECGGTVVGYVEQESVYEDAARMVESQIVYTGNEQKWSLDPTFTLSMVHPGEVSDTQQLVDTILQNSGEEIIEATGLYVDDTFYGATTDGEALRAAVEAIKAPYVEQYPNAEIQFVQDVQLRDGLYLNESVEDFSALQNLFSQPVAGQKNYTVQEGDTPWTIALANNITVDQLYALNPQLDNGNYMVPGMSLVISQSVPFLRVQAVQTEVVQSTIPYETITTEDNTIRAGQTKVTQKGVEGLQETTYQVTYIDGQEASRVQVGESVVLSEPVDELVSKGTYVSTEGLNRVPTGSGTMIFPIGSGFTYMSRGFWGVYSHNGLDLCAAYGTPIFAAQSGVVVYAGQTAGGYGIHVQINHGGGVQTLYGHCSALAVSVGQYVTQGQVIAYVGSTGNSTGNHCHFEVIVNRTRVDPSPYINYYG